jgi:hypothetical protein
VIAKRVSMKSVRKSGFAALVRYIVDAQHKNERVGTVFITNCQSDQQQVAVTEILNTQVQNMRATSDKTYHLIVSFRAGEQPDDATLRVIEARICDALGYGEHQRISAVHRDTDNLHMHVAINKIHPTRYTMHEPFNDFRTLGQVCEQLERDFQLEPDNHQAGKSAAENRAADMERHAGVESLLGWIKRECVEQIQSAQSWMALHSVMRENGLRLHERGNGLVVSAGDGTTVKASSIAREYSKARLEARFGPFVPAPEPQAAERPAKTYAPRPMRSRVNTDDLYATYKKAQQHAGATRASECAQVRARKNRLVDAAKRGARLKRALIKIVDAGRPAKRLMYAVVGKALLTEIKTIGEQHAHERQKIHERHGRRTWADWLRDRAVEGDGEALAALRARPGGAGLQGDTLTGKGRRQAQHPCPEQDSVTKQGTIIYRVGAMTVRDDGDKLHIAREANQADLQAALHMALARYGNCISVNGGAVFKENVVRAAASSALSITFDDADLERRRHELLQTIHTKERQHEPFIDTRQERPAAIGIVRGGSAAFGNSDSAPQRRTDAARAAGGARKPDVGAIGRSPLPESQNRLRGLSELGMVRFASGTEVLRPDHVRDHLEQQGVAANNELRRPVSEEARVNVASAAEQYIFEREQERRAGMAIPRHLPFSNVKGPLVFAGTRMVAGQGLALLRHGDDILVMPADDTALRRLKLRAIGDVIKISAQGLVKPRGRGR